MTPAWPAMICVAIVLAAVAGRPSAFAASEALERAAAALEKSAEGKQSPAADAAPVADAPGAGLGALRNWFVATYDRAPALVFGLAALLAVPPLLMAGLVLKRREAVGGDVTQLHTKLVNKTRSQPGRRGATEGPLWPSEAWIEIEGAEGARHGIGRTVVRIGREGDNDICLTDKTVHRYHAAVHRTEDAEFVITDLSSAGGNGVLVNGRAVNETRLEDGDVIELGLAKLKFVAKPA